MPDFFLDEQIAEFEKAAHPVFDQIIKNRLNVELFATFRELKARTKPSLGAEVVV